MHVALHSLRIRGAEADSWSRTTRVAEPARGLGGLGGPEKEGEQPRRWSKGNTERVTINDASAEELDAIYGVGPAIAERVVAHRRRSGRIKGPDDLVAIDGIDGAAARTIAGQVEFG